MHHGKSLLRVYALVLLGSLAWFHAAFAGRMIKDSDFRIRYDRTEMSQAWAKWKYDPEKHDCVGDVVPSGYVLRPGHGFRKKGAPPPKSEVDLLVVHGKYANGTINAKGARVSRSRMNARAIKAFLNGISGLAGAYLDGGHLFLVGRKRTRGRPVDLVYEDMVVVFRSMVADKFHGALASIEAMRNPMGGPSKGTVQYKGQIQNTHVGQVLFEADRTLKTLGLGCDNIAMKEVFLRREWHQNKFDFIKITKANQQEEWHRFWFFSDGMKVLRGKKNSVLQFEDTRMAVKVQRTKEGGSKRAFYFEEKGGKPENKFAAHFVEYYPNFENEYGAVKSLTEMAKLIAIAKWLYRQGIALKFSGEDLKGFYGRFTPSRTPIIQVSKTRIIKDIELRKYEVTEISMSSSGGVEVRDFDFKKKKLTKFRDAAQSDSQYVVFRLF